MADEKCKDATAAALEKLTAAVNDCAAALRDRKTAEAKPTAKRGCCCRVLTATMAACSMALTGLILYGMYQAYQMADRRFNY